MEKASVPLWRRKESRSNLKYPNSRLRRYSVPLSYEGTEEIKPRQDQPIHEKQLWEAELNQMKSQYEERIETLTKREESLRKDLKDRMSTMHTFRTQLEDDRSKLLARVETQSDKILEQRKEIAALERLVDRYQSEARQRREEDRISTKQTFQAQSEDDRSKLLAEVATQSEKILEQKKEIESLQRLVDKHEKEIGQRRDLHELLEREKTETQVLLGRAQGRIEVLMFDLEHLRGTLVQRELQIEKMQEEIDRRAREDAHKAEEERRKTEVAEARRRMLAMLAEEEERKRQAEERRKAMEKARREREEAERKAREKEEKERKEKERKEKLRREQEWETATQNEEERCKHRDEVKWGNRRWTKLLALKRYRALMDEFERIRFSESQPLTVRSVPWPVLEDPFRFDLSNLDWSMVEHFFNEAKSSIGSDMEYRGLIERSHRMFHPDRWKSRRLGHSVKDRVLRDTLERAGNIVSQVVTPLWRESRS